MKILSNSLMCSGKLNPLSAEAESVYFGYKLQSDISGDKQTAYRIIVSDEKEALEKEIGNVWDSGKVISEESVNIEYLGRKLENGSVYYWKVQVWDINGEKSQWSESAFFRISIEDRDWQGKWISIADIPVMMMGESAEKEPAPQLRRKFRVKKNISEAYLQICGLGYYDLWINGDKAGDIVLDPAPTKFDDTILYQTYDIKNLLEQGDNAIGVVLGNGWYNCFTQDAWCYDKATWRGYPRMLLQLDIVYMDSEKETVVSDTSWKASTGPITFNGVRNGETYDARLEKDGWNAVGYDDTDWNNAAIVTPPGGKLKPQNIPPIRKISTLSPISVAEVKPKVWVYDFGKNISGWAHIKMKGNAGDELTIKYSERIYEDGNIDRENISRLIFSYDFQTDKYIFKGTGVEEWEPRFTYHGFQYIEISGVDKAPDINEISAIVVHTDLKEHGGFTCSDQLINKIQECAINSTLTNFHGIPTDCPHREKNGWTGDANLSAEQALMNLDIASAYSKWLVDFLDVQRKSGQLPGIVPTSSWGYNWGSGPAWDSAIILMPWSIYVYTGDKQILKTMYFGMKKYMGYIESMAVDNLVEFGLGDWCPPEESVKTPTMLTDTGYYYVCSKTMAKIANVLCEEDDRKYYVELSEKIQEAFYGKFINIDEGVVGANNQTSFGCALFQDIAYEKDRESILSCLLKEIERCGYHIDCGILGAKYVMQSLTQMGRSDIAFKIATQDTYPGWGHWIKSGATSLWEDWEGKNSLNHHMFSDISAFFYKGLAGIVPDETAPGFKHFYIQPSFVDGLDWVKAWHDSPYGRIVSEWDKTGKNILLRVSVPVGTTATVRIEIDDSSKVTINGDEVLFDLGIDNRKLETTLISGNYAFTFRTL